MKKAADSQEQNADLVINADETQSGTSHLNDPMTEESELEKLRAELEA
jgi:hypothetical protein